MASNRWPPGRLDRLEVPLSTGVTAQNAADVNRREKFLIWGSIFLVGRGRPENARRKGEVYCAPLLYWPARIEQEGSLAHLSIDLDEQHINFPLLASLIDAENDEQAQAYAEAILAQVPTAPFDTAAIREFAAVVARVDPRPAHRRPSGMARATDRGRPARSGRIAPCNCSARRRWRWYGARRRRVAC